MEDEKEAKIFCGNCPDSHCGKLLYFMSELSADVHCSNCGQKHPIDSLLNLKETDSSDLAVGNLLKSMLFDCSATKKGTELVKVKGLSNYHCKLVSPLLTSYGMDKNSGKAKLLSELGQPDVFDCSVLGNRAFLIDKEHLEIDGYGRDKTGSIRYLKATLDLIDKANEYKANLVPLHADGDGHCLVHAISKAVVGRELLWHPLRQNLKDHLKEENFKYQALFREFIDNDEWNEIIAEADPDFYPETNEPFGLRNMHVFGLANVLHRPIILLDSTEGMQSSGDYSGVFLPALLQPEKCTTQGVVNKPLVIAWSSLARNHYVPLVGIKDLPLPKIPHFLLPKAWGVPNQLVAKYIEFDENGCCVIGGTRSLPESYVERLVSAMNEVFFEKHQVCPELVADVKQFIYKSTVAPQISNSWAQVTELTCRAVESGTLYRCLSCQAVQEDEERVPRVSREPGGKLYTMAESTETGLVSGTIYSFLDGVICLYDVREDILKPIFPQCPEPLCNLCSGAVRHVCADGMVKYENGDRTSTKAGTTKGCGCGFKHFWDGKEYDSKPKRMSIPLEWNGKKVEEEVLWFDLESDPNLNSNAYEVASGLVQKHFPGEFGSELLIKKVVDRILQETAVKQKQEEAPRLPLNERGDQELPSVFELPGETSPSKIILTGPKKKTLHKEELTMSDAERLTKARTQHHAAYSQKRKSAGESPKKRTGSVKLGKQEVPKAKENSKQTPESKSNSPLTSVAPAGNSGTARDRKIRLSSSDGRQATVTLSPGATFGDLQEAVVAQLGIAKDRQKFRYGFPPRELKPPEVANETLPLTHGDRVSVEQLPERMDHVEQESREENVPPLESMETGQESSGMADERSGLSDDEFDAVSREQLATDLLNLLRGALNVDRWDTLQHQPEEFERGGSMYEKVTREIGPLRDDQHCSITELPGKTFAYNAKEDRLEICLGLRHITVQPLDPALLSFTNACSGDATSAVARPSSGSRDEPQGLGSFSGVLRHRDAAQGRAAFSGKGRTLGEEASNEKQGVAQGEPNDKEKTSDGVAKMEVEPVGEITAYDHDAEETMKTTSAGNGHPCTISTVVCGKEMSAETTTVGNGEQSNELTMSTDVEMKSKNPESMVGNILPVPHEVTGVQHELMGDAHEMSGVQHAITGVHDEMSGVQHAITGVHDEMSGVQHEMTDVQQGLAGVQYETSGVQHELMGNTHEMSGVQHELMGDAHEMSGVQHAITGVHDEMSGVQHEMAGVVQHEMTENAHEKIRDHGLTNSTHEITDITHEVSADPHGASQNPHDSSVITQETQTAAHEFSTPVQETVVGLDHSFQDSLESTNLETQATNSNVDLDLRCVLEGKREDEHHGGTDGDTQGDEMHIEMGNGVDDGVDKGIRRETLEDTERISGTEGNDLEELQERHTARDEVPGERGTGNTDG